MKKYISAVMIVLALFLCAGCERKALSPPSVPLGVWWWDSDADAEPYLDFAQRNNVTEIYYCDSGFDEDTRSFIENANVRGIKVYWLAGEYEWLRDSSRLYRKIEDYLDFQKNGRGFEGIHLDIEPHQDPDFKKDRKFLLEKLVSLVYGLSADYPDISFDYDIPFWIEDETELNGKTLPAYAHVIENAGRTFIMSYRDTAEDIYKTAQDEIEYAKSVGKTLFLGVETYSKEGDNVSFMEEGRQYMYGEMDKLGKMIPEGFGISIHQIKTWYDLQD